MRVWVSMAFVLAGCIETEMPDKSEVTQQVQATAQSCNAADFARFVGQPASILEMMDLPENVRVLTPDGVATTDHRPDRVNLEIDVDGLISRVWCG